MLHSIQKLEGIRILAADEQVGAVEEVYFDDEQWVVRYLVVDTGRWLGRRRALISPNAVQSIDWQRNTILVNLSRTQVEGSPGIDTAKPVSRQRPQVMVRYGRQLAERGIVLTGGSALLRDIDKLIMEETGLPALIADDPLTCVARGGGRILELTQAHRRGIFDLH